MLNPFAKKNEKETGASAIANGLSQAMHADSMNSTAIQTIKLMGDQILELRSVVNEQAKAIKKLHNEMHILKNSNEEIRGDMDMITISHKDLGNQLRSMKQENLSLNTASHVIPNTQSSMVMPEPMPVQTQAPVQNVQVQEQALNTLYENPSPEKVAQEHYPNYERNKLLQEALENLNKGDGNKAREVKTFEFGKFSKFLRLK